MADSRGPADRYLHEVEAGLDGPARTKRRLLAEIGSHLEDAIASNLAAGMQAAEAEQQAVIRLGSPASLADAWDARCSRLRARQRRRIATIVAAATFVSVLGVVQHADGRQDPGTPSQSCSTQVAAGSLPPPHSHCR